jgi:hypothetical protein
VVGVHLQSVLWLGSHLQHSLWLESNHSKIPTRVGDRQTIL